MQLVAGVDAPGAAVVQQLAHDVAVGAEHRRFVADLVDQRKDVDGRGALGERVGQVDRESVARPAVRPSGGSARTGSRRSS